MRRVLLGVLGLVLLAGCGAHPVPPAVPPTNPPTTPPTTSTSPPPTLAEAECSPDGTAISVVGTDAAMGLRVLAIELVNCGSRTYPVIGYPDVRLFDAEYAPITVAVGRGSAGIATVPEFDVPPRAVTLRPGERARSGLLWRNLVTDATVDAATAVHLDLALTEGEPWRRVPLVVPDELGGALPVTVDLGNTGRLGVQPWTKAPSTPGSPQQGTPTHPKD